MNSSFPANRLRACAWAGLSALAAMTACSKDEKPTASQAQASTDSSTPAPALPADATPEQRLIAQARAAVGPEAKLDGITGLLMTGKIFDDKNVELGSLLLLFQKPNKQHTELRMADQTRIQGSDGVIGWAMSVDKNDNKSLAVLKAPDEMQNIYTTMENLYFYRATDRVKGSVVRYEGDVDYRGAKAHKISFQYPNSLTYVRYFDATTGALRGTVMLPSGSEVVESGTIDVNGVKFPAVLNNYNKDGKLTQVVKFEKINLNPTVDPKSKVFDLPNMVTLAKAAATNKAATGTAKPAAATTSTRPAATSGTGQSSGAAKPPGASGAFPPPESLMKKN